MEKSTVKKYFIVMRNRHNGSVKYKQYKCIEGWTNNKNLCWKFTKQGAMKIINRLQREYYRNLNKLEFDIEEA